MGETLLKIPNQEDATDFLSIIKKISKTNQMKSDFPLFIEGGQIKIDLVINGGHGFEFKFSEDIFEETTDEEYEFYFLTKKLGKIVKSLEYQSMEEGLELVLKENGTVQFLYGESGKVSLRQSEPEGIEPVSEVKDDSKARVKDIQGLSSILRTLRDQNESEEFETVLRPDKLYFRFGKKDNKDISGRTEGVEYDSGLDEVVRTKFRPVVGNLLREYIKLDKVKNLSLKFNKTDSTHVIADVTYNYGSLDLILAPQR